MDSRVFCTQDSKILLFLECQFMPIVHEHEMCVGFMLSQMSSAIYSKPVDKKWDMSFFLFKTILFDLYL